MNLAGVDRQVDALEDLLFADAGVQVSNFQQRSRLHLRSSH
jgi:hypothetical protein